MKYHQIYCAVFGTPETSVAVKTCITCITCIYMYYMYYITHKTHIFKCNCPLVFFVLFDKKCMITKSRMHSTTCTWSCQPHMTYPACFHSYEKSSDLFCCIQNSRNFCCSKTCITRSAHKTHTALFFKRWFSFWLI